MTNEEIYLLQCHAEGNKLYRLGERIPFEYADTMPDVCRNQGWLAAKKAGVEFGCDKNPSPVNGQVPSA